MPELFEQEALFVEDDADYAIDKEIPFEDNKPVEVDEDEISVVNLPPDETQKEMWEQSDRMAKYIKEQEEKDDKEMSSGEKTIEDFQPPLAAAEDMVVEEDAVYDFNEPREEYAEKAKEAFPTMEGSKEAEKLEVEEEGEPIPGSDARYIEEKVDEAKDQKPTTWEQDKDHSRFIAYITQKIKNPPRHSGETIDGCERCKNHYKACGNEMTSAMRSDLKAQIDEQQIDSLRKEIDKNIASLDKQINKLKKKQRKADLEVRLVSEGQCEKCESSVPMWHDIKNNKMICMHCEAEEEVGCEDCDGLEKKANTPILNVYITAFERAISGILVNAVVSGGKNIDEVYQKLKKKYNFTPQQELSVCQIVSDMGYPVYLDRGRFGEDNQDPSDPDGACDFQTGYYA